MNFITQTFGASAAVAAAVVGWIFYLYDLAAWQRVLVVVGGGVVAVIVASALAIGIDYLVRKYYNRKMLQTW
ncbi:hypothetical protein ACQCT3_02395 [Sutcliffiella horikoshii]|uniref:hypothetical protein n=1 Tax=Sutcliffiella horikoshii TaxID=79883 RepID=UPI003CF1D36B